MAAEIEQFFAQPHVEVGAAQRKLKQALEKVNDNCRRLTAETLAVTAWLAQHGFKAV